MTHASTADRIQFVIKVSKYCNLRCSYCYEYSELGNKARIPLDDIERFFRSVRERADRHPLEHVDFVWHGGEPLLVPVEYYERVHELQRQIFGDALSYSNSLQTNLTVLTEKHLAFMRDGAFFQSVGVSFDVHGDQRVDTKGKLRTDIVLRNMQTLIDARVPFGAISVLARNTLDRAGDIYAFYDTLGIAMRFLPFYVSAFEAQIGRHGLSFDEIVDALDGILDAWLGSARATPVDPIGEYVEYAINAVTGADPWHYRKATDESVFLVNTDGNVWGVAEAYDPAYCYGNAFRDGIDQLLASAGRRRAVTESEIRQDAACAECPYGGACSGQYVADATSEQKKLLASRGCPVRAFIDRAMPKLQASGAFEAAA